jgi:hypothetical protein
MGGFGFVPQTNGSGSGRPKSFQIRNTATSSRKTVLWIWICSDRHHFGGSGSAYSACLSVSVSISTKCKAFPTCVKLGRTIRVVFWICIKMESRIRNSESASKQWRSTTLHKKDIRRDTEGVLMAERDHSKTEAKAPFNFVPSTVTAIV